MHLEAFGVFLDLILIFETFNFVMKWLYQTLQTFRLQQEEGFLIISINNILFYWWLSTVSKVLLRALKLSVYLMDYLWTVWANTFYYIWTTSLILIQPVWKNFFFSWIPLIIEDCMIETGNRLRFWRYNYAGFEYP